MSGPRGCIIGSPIWNKVHIFMIILPTKLTKLSECVAATQVSNEHISCLHLFMDIEIMLLQFLDNSATIYYQNFMAIFQNKKLFKVVTISCCVCLVILSNRHHFSLSTSLVSSCLGCFHLVQSAQLHKWQCNMITMTVTP